MRTVLAVCGLAISALVVGGCNLQAGLPGASSQNGGGNGSVMTFPNGNGNETAPTSGIRNLEVHFYDHDFHKTCDSQDAQARLARIDFSRPVHNRDSSQLPVGIMTVQFEASGGFVDSKTFYIKNDTHGAFAEITDSSAQYNSSGPLDLGWIEN